MVEAADDICYHIVDLEDGFRMGCITYDEASHLLYGVLKKEQLEHLESDKKENVYFRAKAIHKLIIEVKQVFLDCESEILSGSFDFPLTTKLESDNKLKEIIEFTRKNVYDSCAVVEVQVAGYEVLGGLLEEFITAITNTSYQLSVISYQLPTTNYQLAVTGNC